MKKWSRIALIGSSTGGPAALKQVLEEIPVGFKGILIVAQHIHLEFLEGLAQWLSATTQHTVEVPRSGDSPKPGVVYLAGANGNLSLTSLGTFAYLPAPTGQLYLPNINLVFKECTDALSSGVAAILTGMGEDGAQELKSLRSKGWRTIVQEPATCVVDSMPSVALKLDGGHEVMNTKGLGIALRNYFN